MVTAERRSLHEMSTMKIQMETKTEMVKMMLVMEMMILTGKHLAMFSNQIIDVLKFSLI